MENGLAGKVAIVTGGSKGIGRAITDAYVAAGCKVVIVARDVEALERTRRDLGDAVESIIGDITDATVADAAVERAVDGFGSLDLLVNNAAVFLDKGPLVELDDDDFERTWRTNLHAPLVWTRAAWRGWMGENGGAVINLSSNTSLQATFGGSYVTSKVALNHLTRQLAVELAPKVRVNCIAPGLIATEISTEVFADRSLPRVPPLGRHGLVDDCVGAAVYFAGDASRWVTGQVLVVDGGAAVYDFERGPKMKKPEPS